MPDIFPETLFKQLYNRASTEADQFRLLRAKAALGLSEDDELWPVMMTLDHYAATTSAARSRILKALDDLPAKVEAAVKTSEAAATHNANLAVSRALERGVEQLSAIVGKRSQAATDRIRKRQMLTAAAIGGCMALAFVSLGATSMYHFIDSVFGICTGDSFELSDGRSGCFD